MIVGERLEKFDRLRLVIVAPSCRLGLTGPKYGRVLGMPLFKGGPVLCVPRIVECPHELKIVLCHVILPKPRGSAGLPRNVLAIPTRDRAGPRGACSLVYVSGRNQAILPPHPDAQLVKWRFFANYEAGTVSE